MSTTPYGMQLMFLAILAKAKVFLTNVEKILVNLA
jgi:hypothetical protein